MLTVKNGILVNEKADALVNAVNTAGIMDKGIPLQFKVRFPKIFTDYNNACKKGKVKIGKMYTTIRGLHAPRYIIHFPVKKHWTESPQLSFIERGLDDLKKVLIERQITSVALPPLGFEKGGLNWDIVKPLIIKKLEGIENLDITLYEPHRSYYRRGMIQPQVG